MRYRLGRFVPKPGSGALDSFRQSPGAAALLDGALEEMLQVPLSAEPSHVHDMRDPWRTAPADPAPAPDDLLEALPPHDRDRPWVESVFRSLEQLSEHTDVRLLVCDRRPGPDGFMAIAVTADDPRGEVRPGDEVQAGCAAVRRGEGHVRVMTRVFRVVCDNGSIVSAFDGEETSRESDDVAVAVLDCFDPIRFETILARLQLAAGTGVPDVRPMLDEMGYVWERGLMDRLLAEIDAYARRKASYYDLMNILTDAAKRLDFPERFDLEEEAGRIAWLRVPPRRRPRSNQSPSRRLVEI
jgi:hypothetical protein